MALTLGIDASTQSVSALVIDTGSGRIVAEASVNFSNDLPHYGAPQGFIPGGRDGEVHADPLMWLDALDLCLQRLKDAGADLAAIVAISGAGQQHGTVYLNGKWQAALSAMDPAKSLAEQFAPCLSRKTSPIWMDTSTSVECREIAGAVGGDAEVCARSGSIAIERFSGPQIRRFYKTSPEAYAETRRIHLVSSFLASIMAGADAPMDHGDGAGMNLLNLKTLAWDDALLAATADGLAQKLPPPSPSATTVGGVAQYFVRKYGLAPGTPVVAFTGDNPSSLVGMGAAGEGRIVISLGTSDTLFAAMQKPVTDPNGFGHVFGNPMGGFMSLVCFLNGSLAREKVRDRLGVGWEAFEGDALRATPAGNNGNVMLPFFGPEITPRIDLGAPVLEGSEAFEAWADKDAVVRACLEGQFINMWLHTQWLGVTPDTILLTGGASENDGIAQVVANVFQAKVLRIAVSGSVALGAALRAADYASLDTTATLANTCAPDATRAIHPDASAADAYAASRDKYQALLARASGG